MKTKLAEGLLTLLAVAVVARVVYGLLGLSTSGTAPAQNNWGSRMTRIAITALALAIAIYIAARLIESVAPVLIVCAGVAAAAYAVTLITRRKRDRW